MKEPSTRASGGREDRETNELAIIRAGTEEALELLRTLVRLMLPRQEEDSGGGVQLHDMIVAMVAQQREIAAGVEQLQVDMTSLLKRFGVGIGSDG